MSIDTIIGSDKNIAFQVLDFEREAGFEVDSHCYDTVNDVFETAKKNPILKDIENKSVYDVNDVINTAEEIYGILSKKGFEYKAQSLFYMGLKSRRLDCKYYSLFTLGIAQEMKLPIKAVLAPEHVFCRFILDENKYGNIETTIGMGVVDNYYKKTMNISLESIKRGIYLKTLTKRESKSVWLDAIASSFIESKKYNEALKYDNIALDVYPDNICALNNKGNSLISLKRYREAIGCYNESLNLNPKCINAYIYKGISYDHLKDYEKALDCFDELIRKFPNSEEGYKCKVGLLHNLERHEEAYECMEMI